MLGASPLQQGLYNQLLNSLAPQNQLSRFLLPQGSLGLNTSQFTNALTSLGSANPNHLNQLSQSPMMLPSAPNKSILNLAATQLSLGSGVQFRPVHRGSFLE